MLLEIEEHLRYLQLRGQARTSVYGRRCALARLEAALGVPLLQASAADLAAWRAALALAPVSVVAYVSHARGFYDWAIAAGLRTDNPCSGLPLPRLGRRLPRPIGEDELAGALTGAPPRIRPWLVLAGWAGFRAVEIAYLRRERILDTLETPLLLVAEDATKGGHERIVPMSTFVRGELQLAGLPRSGWAFPRRDGRPGPNTPQRVSQLANAYLHSCGLDETLHQCRHWFGTQVYQRRRDLRMAQELMGHQRPESTAGYVMYDQADAAAVVEEIPAPRWLRVVSE